MDAVKDDSGGAATQARRATGAEVVRLRAGLGWTPGELAKRAGLSEALVRRYERGNEVLANLWHLHCLAAALGVTAGELVDAGRPVRPSEATGPDERGPGRRPVFVLATVTEATETGFRLIRWDPRTIGTHWEPRATTLRVSHAALAWASQRLDGSAYIAGPASDLLGHRAWYVGTMGRHPTPVLDDGEEVTNP